MKSQQRKTIPQLWKMKPQQRKAVPNSKNNAQQPKLCYNTGLKSRKSVLGGNRRNREIWKSKIGGGPPLSWRLSASGKEFRGFLLLFFVCEKKISGIFFPSKNFFQQIFLIQVCGFPRIFQNRGFPRFRWKVESLFNIRFPYLCPLTYLASQQVSSRPPHALTINSRLMSFTGMFTHQHINLWRKNWRSCKNHISKLATV